jgi:hypothetical protein
MKRIYTLAFAALLGAFTLQSCASDPVDPPSGGATKITFTQGAKATYSSTQLDTTESNLNKSMSEGRDTLVQTTLNTNLTYSEKTGVTMKANHYLAKNEHDTTYYWQDADDNLYIYNFGLDLVNGPTAQAILNQRIDAGWVLAANMKATANATWTAVDKPVTLINLGITVTVKDVVTANGTTNLVIEGKSVATKKFTHVVTATAQLFGELAKAEIEVYVSADHGGIVRQVRKAATYTLPGQPMSRAYGTDLQLITYVK